MANRSVKKVVYAASDDKRLLFGPRAPREAHGCGAAKARRLNRISAPASREVLVTWRDAGPRNRWPSGSAADLLGGRDG
jgi:hypothetical protein